MRSRRPARLIAVPLCLAALLAVAPVSSAQQAPPAAAPKPATTQANPFEDVPQAPVEPAKPETRSQDPFESVPEQAEPAKPEPGAPPSSAVKQTRPGTVPDVIEDIEFRGSRRVPQDTLRALIFSRRGDRLTEEGLNRDFMALWNSGRFDDLRIEREPGRTGWIIRFVVTERRVVRSIKYEGNKSVTLSEILDRFKERKVGLSVESQFDPAKVQRAANVLKEYLAERGRQFATVDPEIRQIPPSTVEITFKVKEGPKVKVGKIEILDNKVFSDRAVRRAMRNLRPIGIPRSILFENIFSKSYDAGKLDQDHDFIRNYYQERGYFTARVVDQKVNVRDVGGNVSGFRIPLFKPNRPGKKADIALTLDEGKQYRLNNINFVGVKLFKTPELLMRPLFQMDKGDVFSTAKLRKGIENMRKLYGQYGYIDFVPEPDFDLPNSNLMNLTFNVDEGKQFFVRRIDFSGNTTTRDKVIRREILLDEGHLFNKQLWEVSILRLNQLGYFEQLKEEEAATVTRNTAEGKDTVDITLKVKERGKNSVQLNGGVSGIAGSFIGFSYATNNFLGMGETLSLESQLGDRIRNVTFGFTEPYFLDRPIQVGFTVYTTRFNFDYGREVSLLSGRNYIPIFEQVGRDNLLNYVSNGYGFTTFMSYPLRRSFARLGVSYGFDTSKYDTLSATARNYFQYLPFQNLGGPNQLSGIRTSRVVPSYSYNTVNHPITPTGGKSLFISTSFAGSVLGGNVQSIEPTIDGKWFFGGLRKGHVIGMHGLARFITGYGGRVAPPFNRFYMGGEQDIRGFEIWGISPMGFIPDEGEVAVYNNDGTPRLQKVISSDGKESFAAVTQKVPFYRPIFPGGDTQMVGNFEYRIPIFGPVILAAFADVGINKISRPAQLTLQESRLTELNSRFPQATFSDRVVIAPGTQNLRSSVGLELQVMMPVVNAPFRFYWAYNPNILQTVIQTPIVADRSFFPNQATYEAALNSVGQVIPWFERRRTFRFSIGRTF